MRFRIPRSLCWAAVIAALVSFNPHTQGAKWFLKSVKSSFNNMPGAVGDGVTDDTAAIDRAIAGGTSIYFPPGIYLYMGRMSLPLANTSYRLHGDGPGVSTILFSSVQTTAGIYGPNMGKANLNVEGLTLLANHASCGTAIEAIFGPNLVGGNYVGKFRNASIHNVQIRGSAADGTGINWWSRGIRLFDAQDSVIDKVEISGGKNLTTTGILWETASGDFAAGLQISNIQIEYCKTALETIGPLDGLSMTGFALYSCGRGSGNPSPPAIKFGPGGSVFQMVHGEIDFVGNGVDQNGINKSKISNVYFKHTVPDLANGAMLKITGVTDAIVSESTFYGGNGLSIENGVTVIDSNSVRIDGNSFTRIHPTAGYGIGIFGTSTLVRITDNLFSSDVTTPYSPISFPPPPTVYAFGNDPQPP